MAKSSPARTSRWHGFSIADLERIWRLDSPSDRRPLPTRLLLRRVAPFDVRTGALAVSLDDRPVQAELRYGETVTMSLHAGSHLVTIAKAGVRDSF